jgi:regulator of sirC expression with transglutaminase-like and TPR domain
MKYLLDKFIYKWPVLTLLLFLTILWTGSVEAATPAQIRTVYHTLNPNSVAQQLAFYTLYPQSQEGQNSLQCAWVLLSGRNAPQVPIDALSLNSTTISSIVTLVNKYSPDSVITLSQDELQLIERLACRLPNRKLRGHHVIKESDLLSLPPEQIDLARGLFLAQLDEGGDPNVNEQKTRSYEALIDLMALQILARLPDNASSETKIRAMNDFIFTELGFRFPPQAAHAKNIDVYTFLPSVLDSRRGVCLGVSILYLCLAQRLDLPLEIITPPGHIYVRHPATKDQAEINIETTARGIHIDSEEYLGLNNRSLQKRNIKEVIGLAFFNQASVFWSQNENRKALTAYQRASRYMPDDMLLQELMAYQHILVGNDDEGRKSLEKVRHHLSEHAISQESIPDDYLNGTIDAEGIKAVFMQVDETRESILKKKEALVKTLERYPKFRAGIFHLAVTWLQLHRDGEGLEVLKQYHRLEPEDPTAEYYLTVLSATRMDYNSAWKHFHHLEQILQARNHQPKLLADLRRELNVASPE